MSGTAAGTAPATSSPTLPVTTTQTSPALSSTAAGAITSLAPPTVSLPPLTVHHANVSSYIRFYLDPAQNNCHRWRHLFRSVATKYNGLAHIDATAHLDTTDPEWRRADISVLLWYHATVVDSLLDVVMTDDATALDVWTRLERYFLAKWLPCDPTPPAVQQSSAGRLVHRRIGEYTRRLKNLATALADVGKPVSNGDLTQQLLHGLGKPFHAIGDIIADTVPLPDFETAVSRLSTAEEKMQQRALLEGTSALVIHGGPGGSSSGPRGADSSAGRGGQGAYGGHGPPAHHDSCGGPGQGSGGGQGNGGYGRGHGRGDGGRGSPQPAANTPWMGYFAPYGVALPRPAWVPPNAAGVLGPRPAAPTQAHPVMFSHQAPYPAPAPYTAAGLSPYPAPAHFGTAPPPLQGPVGWDQQALFNHAYSNIAGQHPNSATDWVMDSGASSHVTGQQGSRQQDGSHALQ